MMMPQPEKAKKAYIPGLQPQGEGWIKLNTNENPYPTDVDIPINLANLRRYPDPDSHKLKAAIATKYNVSEDNVFCGNGSDEVLALAFQAFFSGTEVSMPSISYGFYPVWADAYGVTPRFILLDNWRINWCDYSGNTIIANPNAPTGLATEITDIPEGGVVIIDEAYIDFANTPSAIDLTHKYDNLLVVQTLSKAYSLAGLRVGFAVGNKKLIQQLKLFKDCFNSYPMDSIAEEVATAAIQKPPKVAEVIKTREWLKGQIPCLDSQANFVFYEVENAKNMYEHLLANKILVRYWDAYPNHLRVSIGTQAEMEAFICCVRQMKQQ